MQSTHNGTKGAKEETTEDTTTWWSRRSKTAKAAIGVGAGLAAAGAVGAGYFMWSRGDADAAAEMAADTAEEVAAFFK